MWETQQEEAPMKQKPGHSTPQQEENCVSRGATTSSDNKMRLQAHQDMIPWRWSRILSYRVSARGHVKWKGSRSQLTLDGRAKRTTKDCTCHIHEGISWIYSCNLSRLSNEKQIAKLQDAERRQWGHSLWECGDLQYQTMIIEWTFSLQWKQNSQCIKPDAGMQTLCLLQDLRHKYKYNTPQHQIRRRQTMPVRTVNSYGNELNSDEPPLLMRIQTAGQKL